MYRWFEYVWDSAAQKLQSVQPSYSYSMRSHNLGKDLLRREVLRNVLHPHGAQWTRVSILCTILSWSAFPELCKIWPVQEKPSFFQTSSKAVLPSTIHLITHNIPQMCNTKLHLYNQTCLRDLLHTVFITVWQGQTDQSHWTLTHVFFLFFFKFMSFYLKNTCFYYF